MKLISLLVIGGLLVLLYGCASMNKPSAALIDTKPVVTIGEVRKVSGDHIAFIPANRKFPVEFSVKGNVFIEEASS